MGLTDADLYRRGAKTLVASWQAYASGSRGATVIRSAGVAVAVFPNGPERAFLNNALLERDLSRSGRAGALAAMEAAYASARISRFAAWVHERDQPMRGDLHARGDTDSRVRAAGGLLARCGTIEHPCGSAPMGSDADPDAVLDPDCRVRGLQGLRIADASSLPAAPARTIT